MFSLIGLNSRPTTRSATAQPQATTSPRSSAKAGEPAFYGAVSVGTLGIGFLIDDADVKRAGGA